MHIKVLAFFILSISLASSGSLFSEDDRYMHPYHERSGSLKSQQKPVEDAGYWKKRAQDVLVKKEQNKAIESQAKNVLFYVGDGMSVTTVTAARIFKGQKVDLLPFGEEAELHMDTLSFTGSSKTFCSDAQVADSACSATAFLCGSKNNVGTIGVTPNVLRNDCEGQANPANQLSSVLAWAQANGKSTGVVTTTRITHATPAGAFAKVANRDWENDSEVTRSGKNSSVCDDIAKQLIMREPGVNINVILGGGRRQFLPTSERDPETNSSGYRTDELNLIETWKFNKTGKKGVYVTGRDELLAINTTTTDYLLGLFDASHLGYFDQQLAQNDPSVEEMTRIAIEILSKNPNGFVLLVEGGRIDHSHHNNQVHRALRETVELDKAIKLGDDMTEDKDTLIVVTSDHGHVMYIAGYPERGSPILEFGDMARDGLPYNTLGYGNGPGPQMYLPNGTRYNISLDDFNNVTYQVPSPIPIGSETHAGEDVLIFAKGPYAHFLSGVHQESYIPHVIAYAACIGDGHTHCDTETETPTSFSPQSSGNRFYYIFLVLTYLFFCR